MYFLREKTNYMDKILHNIKNISWNNINNMDNIPDNLMNYYGLKINYALFIFIYI